MRKTVPLLLLAALTAAFLAGCSDAGGDGSVDDGHDGGHEGHDGDDAGDVVETPSIVGTQPYDGPLTTSEFRAACASAADVTDCFVDKLSLLLAGHGSEAAFWMLENLSAVDSRVSSQSHPMAHSLGRYALEAYGSIERTLADCSYKVFAGCFHGALQGYFEKLGTLTEASVRGLCPTDNPFREYTCLHGVGHGLMLNTHNDMNASLELCDGLSTYFARGSCYGGVFMENIVGYFDSLAGDHGHQHGGPVTYLIDAEDPYYPCNAIGDNYKTTCWLMQTSLILYFEGGDFQSAAAICAAEPEGYEDTCFRSLGRDAAPYSNRVVSVAVSYCEYAPTDEWKGLCMAGYVAESILNFADPERGPPICAQVPATMKGACYLEVGHQAKNMWDDERVAEICSRVEAGYVDECRDGGDLDE